MTTDVLHPLRGVVEAGWSQDALDNLSANFGTYLSLSPCDVEAALVSMKRVFDRRGSVEDLIEVHEKLGCYPGNPYIETHNLIHSINYCGSLINKSQKALGEGISSVPFIAWPKSGSSYISTMLCYGLDLYAARISWRDMYPVRSWAKSLGRFPSVTHEHIYPSAGLGEMLQQSGIAKIVVHSRDPVQALASLARFFDKAEGSRLAYDTVSDQDGVASIAQQYLDRDFVQNYAKWHRGWVDLSGDFEIMFTDYDAFFADPLTGLMKILDFLGTPEDVANRAIGRVVRHRDSLDFNFDVGRRDSWRDVLTADQVDRITAEMPAEIAEAWGRSP